MDNIFVLAGVISVVFFIAKFVEMRFIDKSKDKKPLKLFVRDIAFVFISSILAGFFFFNMNGQIGEFFNTITDAKMIPSGAPQVFTDAPGF